MTTLKILMAAFLIGPATGFADELKETWGSIHDKFPAANAPDLHTLHLHQYEVHVGQCVSQPDLHWKPAYLVTKNSIDGVDFKIDYHPKGVKLSDFSMDEVTKFSFPTYTWIGALWTEMLNNVAYVKFHPSATAGRAAELPTKTFYFLKEVVLDWTKKGKMETWVAGYGKSETQAQTYCVFLPAPILTADSQFTF